ERWRPETHTFHLPCGECTITLEDVALQLGLPIDGNMVTGANFEHLPSTATELEVLQATRGYIMHLIGGVLVPDSHDSELFPHMPTSTHSYGALAHPLSIFRRWSGTMAIKYSGSSVVYNISRQSQYDCLQLSMA
ncbi:hypothetical protein J1N35_041794, partial [Gossypium stocksii]